MSYFGPKDFMLEVARGNVPGLSSINKFGRNAIVGSAAEEELWDGNVVYTWPSSASITHIRSAVDSATTRGQTIELQGLDTNWALTTQTKDTDGADSTTEVALDTALRRVFRMTVLENAVMDQDIQAGPTGFATQQAIITAGNNQTLMALYTVPDGKTAYMTGYYATVNPSGGAPTDPVTIRLWAKDNSNAYEKQLKHHSAFDTTAGPTRFQHFFMPYYKFTQRSDVYLTGQIGGGTSADIAAGFDIVLVDN